MANCSPAIQPPSVEEINDHPEADLEYIPDSGMNGPINRDENGLCDECRKLGYCRLEAIDLLKEEYEVIVDSSFFRSIQN